MNTKKFLTGIATAAAVFSLETMGVFAATPTPNIAATDSDYTAACSYCGAGCLFIDENGDGICDNYNNCGVYGGQGYVDENNDGICDNYNGSGAYAGRGYVDQNNDGICDNYASGGRGCGGGRGGRGGGRGCGRR